MSEIRGRDIAYATNYPFAKEYVPVIEHERARPSGLIMVRHGESEGNRLGRFDANPRLTELGELQARMAAGLLRTSLAESRPRAIGFTPTERAYNTAQIIQAVGGFGDIPLVEYPEYSERCMGVYADQPIDRWIEDHPWMEWAVQQYGHAAIWLHNGTPEDGVEPIESLRARVQAGNARVLAEFGD